MTTTSARAAVHTPAWVVHRAGPMSATGLQTCIRCNATLVDYAGVQATPNGYPKRAQVARLDVDGASAVVQFDGPLLPDMRLCTEGA